MFTLPIACILTGCLNGIPYDNIRIKDNGVSIGFNTKSVKTTKYYEHGKSCYVKGVFYTDCKDHIGEKF